MPLHSFRRLLTGHTLYGVTDEELVLRFGETSDEAAFGLLVRRHAAAVWRVCRAVTGSHHAAEDAFQATFLALARKAGSLRTNVVGWLCRVAYNAALKARRRTRALPDQFDAAAPDVPPPDDTAPLLHAELNRLADKYRLPLVLCYLHGLTQAEAAARLGWPLGTVATRVKRGCDALRTRLTKRGVTFPAAFGTGFVSETAIVAAVRLVEPGTAAPLSLTQLTTEVLHMITPKWPRVAALLACGLLGVAGTVGLLPGDSPVAPSATAAPVPGLTADRRKELETAWAHLHKGSTREHTLAILRLSADPKATTAFLKERFRPVTVTEESAKKTLTDLESDDEKVWQAAYRAIQYHDPRLAMTVPDVFAVVKSNVGRHRLYFGLITSLPADHLCVVRETWYTYSDPVQDVNYPNWYDMKYAPTDDAPQNIARVQDDKMLPSKPANFFRPEWERADRGITILEGFGTPDAIAILKDIADGHPEAWPTKSAKEALEARKK